ncbi:NAD(P)-dependent oxidoreductase [Ramlibacter sp. 2FC]|uniref:NAD(P)-dependent oxidoreductase n=1 Tax=Ramlibacter sp. 2FC TaxID=2502188 RepID=UPI0010F8345D|nr:NAD(P)-dependent oxidoreductase [Ramlibacter sp. 2FC]
MKIGYIGLGALGSELARRFLREHELCVWDINAVAVEEFRKLGARVAPTAKELARQSEVVLLCLPRSSDVRQAIFGPGGLAEGLSAGQLVVDQTSGVPSETRAMAVQLAERGVAMLDAAVSASPHVVAQGSAILMVAGPDDVYERALPVLQAITQTVYRCGTRVGDGQAMKMVNNAMNAGCRLGTLELVAMGRKAGLSLECMTDVLNKGGARNQTTEKMLPAIAQGKSSTNFALSLMLKDVDQAVMLGMDVGAPMPVTSIVRGLLQIGTNTLGDKARLEDMIGLIESMAATRLASPVETVDASSVQPVSRDLDSLRVGYVGLGAMGGALARRLMQSRKLHVYDASPDVAKQFEAEGAVVAPSLPALARACDVIMMCLPTSAHVREALFGQDGLSAGLSEGSIVVDQTSGAPDETRRLAVELQAMGVAMVDAPVTGVPQSAASGTIAIMPGGDPHAYAQVKGILRSISPNVVYCGQVGNGHVVKLVNNAVAAACRAVTYECVAAGFKYGLELKVMSEVLNKGSGWSAALQKISSVLVSGAALSNFQIQLMVKDLKLAAGLGIASGAPMMISNAARSLFEAGANELGGGTSIEEMTRLYEAMSGIKFKSA